MPPTDALRVCVMEGHDPSQIRNAGTRFRIQILDPQSPDWARQTRFPQLPTKFHVIGAIYLGKLGAKKNKTFVQNLVFLSVILRSRD